MELKNARKPILILGIGNILLSDEGIGVRVVEQLQKLPILESVEVVDGGTGGADLIDLIAERQKVIIIDAIQADCKPGTILRFSMDDFLPSDKSIISLHNLGISETVLMARLLGCEPKELVIFGIRPKNINCGLELSEELSHKISTIVEIILAEIEKSQPKVA